MFRTARDPHRQIAQSHVTNPESTISVAAQATAARLLVLLRARYPGWCAMSAADFESSEHPVARVISALRGQDYSAADLTIMLDRLHVLANNHPEKTWSASDSQWSTNRFFDGKKGVKVKASPSETLYLVCAALLDDARHLSEEAPDAASSSAPSSGLNERIARLAGLLLERRLQFAGMELQACAGGAPHDLLWLLQGSYLDEQDRLFVFIEDAPGYLLGLLSQFVTERVLPKAPMDARWALVVDWIRWQQRASVDEQSPLLPFVERYHRDWQTECRAFMRTSCALMGINPDSERCANNIQAVVEHLPDFSFPTGCDTTALLVCELYQVPVANGSSELVQARANALTRCNDQLAQMPWSEVTNHHQSLSDWHTAESCFQSLQRHTNLFLAGDDPRFDEAIAGLSDALTAFFRDYHFGAHLPEHFAAIRSAYREQEALFEIRSHSRVVEHCFAAVTADRLALASYWPRIQMIPGLELDDASLTRLVAGHSRAPGRVQPEDFTPEIVAGLSRYDINRLLLHGLCVDITRWTSGFRHILHTLCQSLLAFGDASLREAYLPYFLSNMLLMSLFHEQDLELISGCRMEPGYVLFGKPFFNVFDFSLEFSPEQRTRLFSLIEPHFNRLIVKEKHLRRVLSLYPERLNDTQYAQVWDAVTDRLGDLITNGYQLHNLLSLPLARLNAERRAQVWDAVAGRLGEMITDGEQWRNLLRLSPGQLNDVQRTQLWHATRDRLCELVTEERQLRFLFQLGPELFGEEWRQQVWEAVRDRLGEWVTYEYQFRCLLELVPDRLNNAQIQDVYDAIREKEWAAPFLEAHKQSLGDTTGTASMVSCSSTFFAASSSSPIEEDRPVAARRKPSSRHVAGMPCCHL